MVIDWRAPITRPFYRATSTDRQGVRLRRRFGFADGRLTSFEDEHLDAGEELGLNSDLLREEIERPRVGPMRDIVATIQPDQDELVRAELDTSLCIQGAPGTGKTAVGLHRAAYLLYSYPERLRRSGVLVVGPNSAFLRYIAQVLPALGENGIQQATVQELVSQLPAGRDDPVELAVLKGDARLAEVLRRAVHAHIAKPAADVVPIIGNRRHRIPVERARRYVDDARRAMAAGELRWDSGRERLRQLLAQDVRRQREDAGGAPVGRRDRTGGPVRPGARVPGRGVAGAGPASRADPALHRRRVRPPVRGSGADRRRSWRRWAGRSRRAPPKQAKFSAADLVLLDELVGLITGNEIFVHVVVDEAQDLSAMQCRAVARRCPLGSVTVLGDLAQATTPWAPGSWPSTLRHLGQPAARVAPLTVGYRVPGEVLAVANRLLPHIAPEVPPATSVRAGRDALTLTGDLVGAVAACLRAEGSIAVIAADAAVAGGARAAGRRSDRGRPAGQSASSRRTAAAGHRGAGERGQGPGVRLGGAVRAGRDRGGRGQPPGRPAPAVRGLDPGGVPVGGGAPATAAGRAGTAS